MFADLFDSPWKILIIAIVVLVLFGSRKMPDAARSLGRSMRILKSEIKDLHDDDASADGAQGSQQAQPQQAQPQPPQQLTAPVGVPVAGVPVTPVAGVPVTPADGVPVAPPAPPVSVPVPAEAQQDTRPV